MMYMVFYMTDDLGETFTEMNEDIETFIINGKKHFGVTKKQALRYCLFFC